MAVKFEEIKAKRVLDDEDLKKIDEIENFIDAEIKNSSSRTKIQIESSKIESYFSDKPQDIQTGYEQELIRRYKIASWTITEEEINKIKYWIFKGIEPKKSQKKKTKVE